MSTATNHVPLKGELFIYSPKKRLAAFRVAAGTGSSITSTATTVREPSTNKPGSHPAQRDGGRPGRRQGGGEAGERGGERPGGGLGGGRGGGEGGEGKGGAGAGGGGGGVRGHAIFVPGLTDGLLALGYLPRLAASLDRLGYSLVQPVLSSSYKGYGVSSLQQDVEELDELLAYLSSEGMLHSAPHPQAPSASPLPAESGNPAKGSNGGAAFLLIGHSTGCQDAVFYMKHGRPELRAAVRGVVLQAPVSDREYMASLPETEGQIAVARVRLGGNELMPADTDEAPMTASRFLSLATKDGDDDMFSSDLSPEERDARLGHMASVPTAAFISGADEYMPPGVSGVSAGKELLAEKIGAVLHARPKPGVTASVATTTTTLVHVIGGANHALSDESHAREFVTEVEAFVASLPVG